MKRTPLVVHTVYTLVPVEPSERVYVCVRVECIPMSNKAHVIYTARFVGK